MKFLFHIVIAFISSAAYSDAPTDKTPIVSAELEWEQVPDAKVYEIQVIGPGFEKNFTSPSPIFRIEIPLGKNKARGRVMDRRGVFGEWSGFTEFEAIPLPVDLKDPTKEFQPRLRSQGLNIYSDIRWKPIAGAKAYRFYLMDKNGKIVFKKETLTPEISIKAMPGKFTYNVTAVYSHGVESARSAYSPPLEIVGTKLNPPTLISNTDEMNNKIFKFKTDPKLNLMTKIEYSPFLGTDWEVINDMIVMGNYDAKTLKTPGRYRLSFRQTLPGYIDSEPITKELQIKPTEEQLK